MATITVTYASEGGTSSSVEELSGAAYRFSKIPPIERSLREAIANAKDMTAATLQDLYRGLVLSNFARLDGKGGKAAKTELDRLYPDQATLPGFVVVSGRYNAAGAILHNIRTHEQTKGYALLPSFLLGMLRAGLSEPNCEQRETPIGTHSPEEQRGHEEHQDIPIG